MNKFQKHLIFLIASIFIFVLISFRRELFLSMHRPRINFFLDQYLLQWILSGTFLLIGYFLAKIFNFKWYSFILLFVIIELGYATIFHFPQYVLPQSIKGKSFIGHFRAVYNNFRNSIQFDKNGSRYDKELFYTLKPGKFNFANFEFDTKYIVNSQGHRDSETSLVNPDVIFLGDSFTMGWGVEQNERFSDIISKRIKYKTLNTGISSYGTAREYLMLKRQDLSNVKLIVIQYHDTDDGENHFYIQKNALGNRSEEEYNITVNFNTKTNRYFPFKYLYYGIFQALKTQTDLSKKSLNPKRKYWNRTLDFYKIIDKVREIYKGPIILTYIGGYYTDHDRIDEFEEYAKENGNYAIYFVNLNGKLSNENYFYFDDHLNATGHKIVADELSKKMEAIGIK